MYTYKYILLTKMARKGTNKCNISVAAQIGLVIETLKNECRRSVSSCRSSIAKNCLLFIIKCSKMLQFHIVFIYIFAKYKMVYIPHMLSYMDGYMYICVISAGKMFLIKTKIVFMYYGNRLQNAQPRDAAYVKRKKIRLNFV